jgi:hypothetical protein
VSNGKGGAERELTTFVWRSPVAGADSPEASAAKPKGFANSRAQRLANLSRLPAMGRQWGWTDPREIDRQLFPASVEGALGKSPVFAFFGDPSQDSR